MTHHSAILSNTQHFANGLTLDPCGLVVMVTNQSMKVVAITISLCFKPSTQEREAEKGSLVYSGARK